MAVLPGKEAGRGKYLVHVAGNGRALVASLLSATHTLLAGSRLPATLGTEAILVHDVGHDPFQGVQEQVPGEGPDPGHDHICPAQPEQIRKQSPPAGCDAATVRVHARGQTLSNSARGPEDLLFCLQEVRCGIVNAATLILEVNHLVQSSKRWIWSGLEDRRTGLEGWRTAMS